MSPTRVGASWPADAASVDMRPCLAQRGGPRTHVRCDGSRPERPDGLRWRAVLPTITYPAELPVSGQREEIARAIRDHQVVIVAGATGSGKTTQLPKICLELGRESIAHTQPRRIAARTIAERISEELGVELGGLVGYQVRFTDKVSESTRIKVMTDGILLNEIHRDRELRRYDTIIIDEAHERSLNVDFLLGYLKRLLPRRPDLKVIVTSATIDPESFAQHFATVPSGHGEPAPVIEVSGRTYPVEVRYRPLVAEAGAGGDGEDSDDEGAAADDKDVQRGILDALDELERESSGDVLVFLSGESEIRDAEDAVRAHATRRGGAAETEVLPLYGRLSLGRPAPGVRAVEGRRAPPPGRARHERRRDEPDRARHPLRRRRRHRAHQPLLACGRRCSGCRSRRSRRRRRTSARVAPAARATASRSGSTREEDFERRPEFTEPEILRTNLAAVILQMVSLGLGRDRGVPLPRRRPTAAASATASTCCASSAPLDDGAARRRAAAHAHRPRSSPGCRSSRASRAWCSSPSAHGVSREVLAIVAGLTIQDPRERPLERREQADGFHARFVDPTSDFLTPAQPLEPPRGAAAAALGQRVPAACARPEYLNYLRVREWQDLYRQLVRLAQAARPARSRRAGEPNADGIHRALLAGLLSQIGLRDDAKTSSGRGGAGSARETERRGRRQQAEFVGARSTRFVVFPGSALAKKPPARAHERRARRDEPAVRPHERAPSIPRGRSRWPATLAKRTFSEPHWERRQGSAVAYEKVTLFGVPIVAKRRIQLGARRPGARARALHPARARRGGLGHGSLDRAAVRRSSGATARCAASSARSRSARAVATSSRATRPSCAFYEARVPRGCRGHASVRALVARRAPPTPRPAHDDPRPTCSAPRRTTTRRRLPRPLAAGRPDATRSRTGSSPAPTTTA